VNLILRNFHTVHTVYFRFLLNNQLKLYSCLFFFIGTIAEHLQSVSAPSLSLPFSPHENENSFSPPNLAEQPGLPSSVKKPRHSFFSLGPYVFSHPGKAGRPPVLFVRQRCFLPYDEGRHRILLLSLLDSFRLEFFAFPPPSDKSRLAQRPNAIF